MKNNNKLHDTSYQSLPADENGWVDYSLQDNETWARLYKQQVDILPQSACDAYITGHKILNLSTDKVPQIPDINKILKPATGWVVEPVSALISYAKFFKLLSERKFPSATFIRRPEHFDYITEPDVFHEIFGHCPALTDPIYADFMCEYGKLATQADEKDHAMLARFYWFTVEFGLISGINKIQAYGAGVLSSPEEAIYATQSSVPDRRKFDVIDIFRTPYRIDILQPKYFVISSFNDLYDAMKTDLFDAIEEARKLGMHEPTFPPNDDNTEPTSC